MNIRKRLSTHFWPILINTRIRFIFVKTRWLFFKNKLRFYKGAQNDNFNDAMVDYNAAFHDATFGCGGRMALLLYPLVALLYPNFNQKVLIVGPRTEDDIVWARSLGLESVRGLDLFSYSPWVDIGDAHKTNYADSSYDAVVLAWVLPYTKHPETIITEMRRILRPNGVLGLAWHSVADRTILDNDKVRLNCLNELTEVVQLVGGEVQVTINPKEPGDQHRAVFTRYSKKI